MESLLMHMRVQSEIPKFLASLFKRRTAPITSPASITLATAGQAIMGGEDSVADPTKAKIDLGLSPRPFRETVRQYAHAV